jgi:hypothetical protein
MIKTIQGKTTVITGASSGIGEAFAHEMAARGSHLILTARSADKLKVIAQSINKDYPGINVFVYPMDLAVPEAPVRFSEILKKNNHQVDILVNNAGFGKWTNFLDEDLPGYENMLQVNIGALVKLTWLLLPGMLKKGEGGVINISSTGAFQPCPYIAVYCASKAFVLSFSEALYGEFYKKGVTVTAVCPGYTKTNFFEVANAKSEGYSFASPGQVAKEGMAAFLKGKNYKITGGWNNYIQSQLSRFLPRKMVIAIVGNMFKDSMKNKMKKE